MRRAISHVWLLSFVGLMALGPPAAAQPSAVGQWGPVRKWEWLVEDEGEWVWKGVQAVHMVVLKTGKVLCVDRWQGTYLDDEVALFDPSGAPPQDPNDPDPNAYLIEPPTDDHEDSPFCSAHTQLSDGKLAFFGGGHFLSGGNTRVWIFDPDLAEPPNDPWSDGTPMREDMRRWYPSATTLSDGRVVVIAGDTDPNDQYNADIPAIFDPNPLPGTWTYLENGELDLPYYPFNFMLSSGKLLMAGTEYYNAGGCPPDFSPLPEEFSTRTFNTAIGTWTAVNTSQIKGGSAVMYRPDKIMKAGGGTCLRAVDCFDRDPTNRAMTLHVTGMTPQWVEAAPMTYRRAWLYLIVLPDGKVLATGGWKGMGEDPCDDWVATPEIYDPDTDSWSLMAAMDEPRSDHATAVLLPDARILVAGGQDGPDVNNPSQKTAQIYSPPYLFQGTRPTIDTAPDVLTYGNAFDIETPQGEGSSITKVVLIRLGSATHSVDFDQRYLELSFTRTLPNPDTLIVAAPAGALLAPPGYYMLFILDDGVPSVAKIVQLSPFSP